MQYVQLNLSPLLLDRHLAAGGTDCSSTDRDTARRDVYALLQGWDCTLRNQSHSSVVWNWSLLVSRWEVLPEGKRGPKRVAGSSFFSLPLSRTHSLPLCSLSFLFLVPPPPSLLFFSLGKVSLSVMEISRMGGKWCVIRRKSLYNQLGVELSLE